MKRVLLCLVLIAWSGVAAAVVYKWTDANGKVQYGDLPPAGVHAEIIDLPGSHARPTSPSEPRVAAAPATSASSSAADDDSAKKAVEDDVAQTREKQCSDAQDRYKKLIEGRKLYKAGADGERQYLSSEEIDSERINAKRDVDLICNSPT